MLNSSWYVTNDTTNKKKMEKMFKNQQLTTTIIERFSKRFLL